MAGTGTGTEASIAGISEGKTKDVRIEEQQIRKRSFLRNLSRKRTEKAADELGRHIEAKSGEVPPHQGQVSNGPTWEVGKVDKKRQSWSQEKREIAWQFESKKIEIGSDEDDAKKKVRSEETLEIEKQFKSSKVVLDSDDDGDEGGHSGNSVIGPGAVLLTGEQRWTFEFGDLVESIKKKCQLEPANMPLDSLSLSIWLDVPNPIWNKYSRDFQFHNEMEFQIENHMLLMIKEWALMCDSAETQILGARGKKEIRQKIISEFTKNSDHARLQWEGACKDLLIGIIRAKAKSDGDYARYKVKSGVKFVSTVGGVAISVAGLATLTTPVAAATVVPAVIGLVASVTSCIKQFRDLTLDAAEVLALIRGQLHKVELKWKEPGPNGVWNVKTMRAIEIKNAIFDSMFGDLPEFVCPTIAGLKDKNTLMLKKADGLEQKLHEFVMSIVKLEDGLRELARNNSEFQKQERLIQDMRDEIPQKENEIKSLRLAGDEFAKLLDQAEAALGTKNIKLFVGLIYSLGTLGAGYASPPTELSAKLTSALGTIQGTLDLARENYATVNDDWGKK